MNTPKCIRLARGPVLVLTAFFLFNSYQAQANCFKPRENEVICGDRRICVSGKKSVPGKFGGAEEGFYDRNSCVPKSPVCATLSHLADVYVGGTKNERPAGKALVEIASAERMASVSKATCRKLGIPTSVNEAPPGTPRPPGGSWCRSNAERGGAPGSTHKSCHAMDIYVPGMPENNSKPGRQKLANEIYKSQRRGLNVYKTGRAHIAASNEYFYSSDVRPNGGSDEQRRSNRRHR